MFKLLFVHPNKKFVRIYIPHLKRYFQLDLAMDGLTAIRKVKLNKPALIISDYHLPILSGIALLKFVRNDPNLYSTPFFFLTNYHDNIEALNLGANEWINSTQSNPDFLIERVYYHLKINQYVR